MLAMGAHAVHLPCRCFFAHTHAHESIWEPLPVEALTMCCNFTTITLCAQLDLTHTEGTAGVSVHDFLTVWQFKHVLERREFIVAEPTVEQTESLCFQCVI